MMERVEAEVLVIGGGPGGLAAAATAAKCGAKTLLVDSGPTVGGQIWRGGTTEEARQLHSELERHRVRTLLETSIVDAEDGELRAVVRNQPVILSAKAKVLATGARERFLPFPGWPLPGVFGIGALQAMVKQGLDIDGKEVVLSGTGPLVGAVASYLASRGAVIQTILEQAQPRQIASFARGALASGVRLRQALQWAGELFGVEIMPGCWITEVRSGRGGLLEGVATDGRERWTVRGHYFGVAYGLVPNLELPRLLGCRIRDGSVSVDAQQRTSVEGVFAVGELTGIGGKDKAVAEGRVAGAVAAGQSPLSQDVVRAKQERGYAAELATAFALRDELRQLPREETIVCRCEDVRFSQVKDLADAREARILARCGMGFCQARVCGPAMEFLRGWAPTDPKPPLEPTEIASIL